MVLAHLRNGDTRFRLATGLAVAVATAWRYVHERIDLLAAAAPTVTQVIGLVPTLAYVILDGSLIPIDRIAADRPFCSGKHKRLAYEHLSSR